MFVHRVRNVSRLGVWRNNEQRHTRAQAEWVEGRRRNVVIETPKIVPSNKDGNGIPIRALHLRIQCTHRPIFARADAVLRMLIRANGGNHPTHVGQLSGLRVGGKLRAGRQVIFEPRRVPDVIDQIEDGKYSAGIILPCQTRDARSCRDGSVANATTPMLFGFSVVG